MPTAASVKAFIDAIPDADRRRDCRAVMKIMRAATGASPKMWRSSIVGYGRYHYKYASGREGDWFLAGFSPRKQDLTVYIMSGFPQHAGLMKRLGKHKTGSSCLYLRRLDDVDVKVLEQLVRRSVAAVKKRYPPA